MIKPDTAVGLTPTVRGIRKRKDITINIEQLSGPVGARVIYFPEHRPGGNI